MEPRLYRWNSVVRLSVCHDREPCKMAERIEMPFGLWTLVGIWNHVGGPIRWGPDPPVHATGESF